MAYKVLLADDSVPAQNMGKKILIDAGYDVLTVSNGLEALRKIADTMPDIAILDIFMPGYTGLEICERLRGKAATAELPVILTVGKLEPYRPEDGKHVGSNAVIVKPFAAAELIAAVRSLIGVKRAEVVYSAEDPPPGHIAAPLQEDLTATDEQPLTAAPAEMPAGDSDEPLFAQVESAAAGNAAPSALENPGAGVAAAEVPVESLVAEEPGPESLVFNPDAGRTPFSASVSDATPVDWDVPAEAEPSAVTEFDLESEAPAQDSAEPFQAGANVESWHVEPDAATPITTHVVMPYDAAADAQMASPEPAAVTVEPAESEEAATLEEIADVAVPVAEPGSSPQEEPIFEPPMEARDMEAREEVAPADVAASDTDDGGFPEAILLEDGVADGEDFTAAMDEPVTREEEARRRAFEDLFNSDVPFPLEEPSIPIPATETVALAGVTESSEQEFGEIELEPEIAMDELQDTPVAPAPGLEAWQALEPTPAPDPLFEDETQVVDYSASIDLASIDPALEIEQPTVEDVSSVLGDSYTVRPDVISQPMGQLDAQVAAEEPETPVAAAPVEAAPAEKEIPAPVVASPERSDLVAEVAKVEALLVQMQAVRQVGEATHSHTETEFQQPEAAPYLQSYGGAAAVESAPLEATEEPAIEAAAVPVPVEPELQEVVVAPLPPEPELVSSPLETTPEELANARAEVEDEPAFVPPPEDGLNDAERIHKAVERVFDRFRPLLVAAIVRELVRRD